MAFEINPLKLIIDYYDSLVNQIDIYTEKVLEANSPSEQLVLNNETDNSNENNYFRNNQLSEIFYVDPNSEKFNIQFYVNKTREEMISMLRKLEDETIKCYQQLKKSGDKLDKCDEETIMSVLFADNFPFIVYQNSQENKQFKLFLIVLDFYIGYEGQSCLR